VTDIAPGWYPDPVDPQIQRYWDGEVYVGEPIPADATPPSGPPAVTSSPSDQAQPTATASVSAPPAAPGPQLGAGHPAARTAAPSAGSMPPGPVPSGSMPPGSMPPGSMPPGSMPPGPVPPGTLPPGTLPPGAMSQTGWPAYPKLVLPPPRPHGYRLAGLGSRFIARVIDVTAVLGLNVVVNGWFVWQWLVINRPYWQELTRRFYANESTSGVEPPERSSTLLVIILVLAAALWFAYEVPAQANSGQTLGKRLTHIKVMRLESSEELGFRRSIRRWNTLGLPTLLWTCFGVGFVLQFINCVWAVIDRPLRQALHDKSAVTVVVAVGPSTSDG
jgi:uncharacterized RDD family membrane protein YckC